MGAVENSLAVLSDQTCSSAADEPRVLCIVRNMIESGRQTCRRSYNINLPMSTSCQALIDDIKSKFEHLPKEINVVYDKPSEGNTRVSVNLDDSRDTPIGEVCLHCGDGGKNIFFVYDANPTSKDDDWDDASAAKPKSARSNAIYESSEHSSIIGQVSSVEQGCSNKDGYNVCSASTSSYGNYSFSLSTLPKSETGYVGLVNQAMTCYLNSLLQTLYMTPEFRNAVYRWRFDGVDVDALHSIPYQLQRLFLQLQTSNKRAVETTDITRSFGWDSSEAWHQHDVQELCRVMFDALEKTWKATDQEILINELYQGKMKDYVKCLKCRSVRARPDTYLDLPLVIRPYGSEVGYGSVEQALKAFEEPEILEGSNQYYCEKCEQHCDAHKGLRIVSFPYILTLHLKRFGFNHCTYQRFKLNDRMSFPEVLKFERFSDENETGNETSEPKEEKGRNVVISDIEAAGDMNHEDAIEDEGIYTEEGGICVHSSKTSDLETGEVKSAPTHVKNEAVSYEYQLFSVMIHSGSAVGGHYYAYIRSFKDDQWYSFNDQHVFKISEGDMERTFGGNSGSIASYSSYSSSTNAYMLQYRLIEPSRNRNFMDETDFPEHLKEELVNIFRKEEEELQQQELDRNTCKIKLFVYDDSQEKYTEQKLEVHKSKTLAEATEVAWKQMELTELPLDCVRLVKFNSVHDYVEQSFDAGDKEKSMCCILGGVKSSYHFDLLLETKKPDEGFFHHFWGGIVIRLHAIDLLHEDVHRPTVLRILPTDSVDSLKLMISKSFDLCSDTMTLVMDKGYANFCPLLDPSMTLSQAGFDKVNRVFMDSSGTERYDKCFHETRFCKILERFVNTISLVVALPTVSDIAKLSKSDLCSYYLNRPTHKDSSLESLSAGHTAELDDNLVEVDEGIGESETDIHGRTCAGEVQSEMDLSTCGIGNNEVMSRTSDWCSSICSNEPSHDVNERCSSVGTSEVPGEKEVSFNLGANEMLKRKTNLTLELAEEATNETGVIRGEAEASSELEVDSILCAVNPESNEPVLGDDLNTVELPCDLQSDIEFNDEVGSKDSEKVSNIANDDDPLDIAVFEATGYHGHSVLDSIDSVLPSCTAITRSDSTTACLDFEETNGGRSPMLGDAALDDDIDNFQAYEAGENDDIHSNIPTPVTSPRVSSNGSNSPELENEKELTCPKESEANWDMSEATPVVQESNYSFFRVIGEISGLFEQSLNVEVDRRMSVGILKSHLEPYMGTSADNFRVFRYSPTGADIEMTHLYEQLHNVGSGSKIIIKLGRALKPGEYKLSVYQLLIHESEPIKFLVEVIVQKGITLFALKNTILKEIRSKCGFEIPIEKCRLRKKAFKSPAGIFVTDAGLNDLFKECTLAELLIEAIEGPNQMELDKRSLLQVYLRRWRPSTYQLDPVQEIIVSDWTLPNIRREISLLSEIDEENLSIAKARGTFPCNVSTLDLEQEVTWDPAIKDISVYPMSVADDGAVLFYKDRTEILAELTDEQKRDVQAREYVRLQKAKPAIKIPNKAERPLKIYTVSDHLDSRPNSEPIKAQEN